MSTVARDKKGRTLNASYEAGPVLKEYWEGGQRHRAEGRPVAWVSGNVPVELFWNLGVYPVYPENYSAVCASVQRSLELCEAAEEKGYGVDLCSYSRVNLGIVLGKGIDAPDLPFGGLPRPDLLVTTRIPCLPQVKWWEVVREVFDVPLFVLDATMVDGPPSDVQRRHYLGQLRELIAFLERHAGVRFHEDSFLETLRLSDRAAELWLELLGHRAAVPCPVGGREMCTNVFPLVAMLGHPRTVEFFSHLVDEAAACVRDGRGAVPEERLRLGFDNIPMWYNLGFFSDVEERQAVFVYETYLHHVWGRRIDFTDPWGSFARKHLSVWLNLGLDERRRLLLADAARFKVDGFVFHQNRSCKTFSMGQRDLAQALETELGVPSLIVESDMADPRAYAEAPTRLKMDAFLEVVEARKA